MNNEREQQMMGEAEVYVLSVMDHVYSGTEFAKAINDFCAGWRAADNSRWIPVEERLPEKDNEFEDYSKLVIVTNGKDFWKGMYNYGGEDWCTFDLWRIDDATHWLEIHPPRKEE